MGAAVLIGVWQYMGREDGRKADKNSVRIGVLLYRGDDTFIGTLRTGLEDKAKEYEQETGIKVKLDIMDAKGSQNTQNSQVERLISLGQDPKDRVPQLEGNYYWCPQRALTQTEAKLLKNQ